jgi:hypothetical protein
MMKKQTAIDWLWEQLKENDINSISILQLVEFFNQAKKMECDQIARAWNDRAIHLMGIDYYHDNYGGDHE